MRENVKKKEGHSYISYTYYIQISEKRGTHGKISFFFVSKLGTVPPKEGQLASLRFEIHQLGPADRQ